MRFLVIILILCAFLQTTLVSTNLILLILLCRSYITNDKSNLYLALFFGILVSHLSGTTLGVQSVVYLIVVELARILGKMRVSNSLLIIVPLVILSTIFNSSALSYFLHASIQLWPNVAIETSLSLPIFFLIKLWEERFVVKPDIKLRI